MNLTPMDIHNKQFDRKMRGYDADQVDAFLDRVVDAYGDALDQVVDLKNANQKLQEQVDHYNSIKDNLNDSLIEAQKSARAVKKQAQEESDKILADAKKQAGEKAQEMQDQYDTLDNDYKLLKNKVADFRHQLQDLLNKQTKELGDNDWQYFLDRYYGRNRLYPADGEPVEVEKENAEAMPKTPEEKAEVDKAQAADLESKQSDQPQILAGDSPDHESGQAAPTTTVAGQGPEIVFPDDYKDHK
jgi:cell division initiation protein